MSLRDSALVAELWRGSGRLLRGTNVGERFPGDDVAALLDEVPGFGEDDFPGAFPVKRSP